ncbi:MAG: hypothetical protein HND47_22620 [Chloroflexi bacterium]|nr:hypothetical protein [Chloroflexota bacterium]
MHGFISLQSVFFIQMKLQAQGLKTAPTGVWRQRRVMDILSEGIFCL